MYLQKCIYMKYFLYTTEIQTPLKQDKVVQQLCTTEGTNT